MILRLFARVDTNGDGIVSPEEFAALYQLLRADREDVATALTAEEKREAARERLKKRREAREKGEEVPREEKPEEEDLSEVRAVRAPARRSLTRAPRRCGRSRSTPIPFISTVCPSSRVHCTASSSITTLCPESTPRRAVRACAFPTRDFF